MISIRPIRQKDIAALVSLADDGSAETLSGFIDAEKGAKTKKSLFEDMIAKHDKGWLCSYVVLEDDAPVGCVHSLSGELAADVYKLNCWIAAPHRGQGFAKEGLRLLMDAIHEEDHAYHIKITFIAAVSPGDQAGLKIIRGLGFAEDRPLAPFTMPFKNVYLKQQLEARNT